MEGVLPVKKIYPTVDECKINNLVKCMEEGCQHVFTSESNLALHVAKTHKRSHFTANAIKQYYCPQSGCIYQSDKHFKNMKLLRQHYLKVHIAKDYACDSCEKKFPTDNQLKHHIDYCGVNFKCHECDVFYGCYETLKTHARRKKHHILAKSDYKISAATSSNSDPSIAKPTPILPKNCISLILIPDTDNVYNQGSQTMNHKPKLKSKMTQVTRIIDSNLNSQQTQTGTKNNHFTVETQTMGDFMDVESSKSAEELLDSVLHKSSKTQTDIVESRSTSSNTSFNFNDFEFIAQAETTSSSTQTQNRSNNIISSISTSTHDSIHTDTSDLMNDSINSINNFEFDNCHMETQTDDFMLGEGMFDCDYMSNMYTQTCDSILNEFGFNDIETQTVFDDMLRSVESQTTMSHGKRISTNKDVTHMETQTEMEFRQMLEVIHS